MRITQKMMSDAAVQGMQANLRRLSDTQRQAVTTKRINKPEDDPFGTERALGFRSKIKASETARDNIALSKEWLNATDSTLSDVGDLVGRSRLLAEQGASDTQGTEERQSISIEVNQMLEEALAMANTRHGNQYLFSGFKIDSPAYVATRDTDGNITSIAANGDITGQIVREVEPGVTLGVNVSGESVFPGLFSTLVTLRDSLTQTPFDANVVSATLTDFDTQLDAVLDVQAAVGTKVRRLESATTRMEAAEVGMQELLSKAEDADMTVVASELSKQQFIYQTALKVNGQILSTSLLDYIQ